MYCQKDHYVDIDADRHGDWYWCKGCEKWLKPDQVFVTKGGKA